MDIIARAENAIKGIMLKDKFNNNVLLLKTGHIRKFFNFGKPCARPRGGL
mgnify:CR=1 FL=1